MTVNAESPVSCVPLVEAETGREQMESHRLGQQMRLKPFRIEVGFTPLQTSGQRWDLSNFDILTFAAEVLC